MKDFIGQKVGVGDTIVYPVRQGSQVWLSLARVLATCSTPSNGGGWRPAVRCEGGHGRRFVVKRLDRVVVVKKGGGE